MWLFMFGWLGEWLQHHGYSVVRGGYAVVGGAAAVAGATGTVSAAVITFEVTSQLSYMLPVLLAVRREEKRSATFGQKLSFLFSFLFSQQYTTQHPPTPAGTRRTHQRSSLLASYLSSFGDENWFKTRSDDGIYFISMCYWILHDFNDIIKWLIFFVPWDIVLLFRSIIWLNTQLI